MRLVVDLVAATSDAAADREANTAARSAAVAQATANARAIAGGFQANADGGGSQMAIGLRVPADQYDPVVDKLAAIGEVNESHGEQTAEVIDVNSRVEKMTASRRPVLSVAGPGHEHRGFRHSHRIRIVGARVQSRSAATTAGLSEWPGRDVDHFATLTAVTDTPASDPPALIPATKPLSCAGGSDAGVSVTAVRVSEMVDIATWPLR